MAIGLQLYGQDECVYLDPADTDFKNSPCVPIDLENAPSGPSPLMPSFTVVVNVHFIKGNNVDWYEEIRDENADNYWNGGDYSKPVNGITFANLMVDKANEFLDNLSDNPLTSEDYIGEAFIDYELNEIYFWDDLNDYNNNYSESNTGIEVRIIDDGAHFHGLANRTKLRFDIRNTFTNERKPWETGNLFNHEFFHLLLLDHSFEDCNDCKDIDIDPVDECNNGSGTSDSNCGDGNEGGCNNQKRSNNIMNYGGGSPASLTPCQMAKSYNVLVCEEITDEIGTWDLCDNPGSTEYITSNTIWSQSIYKNNNVIVQPGITLSLDACQLFMGPNKYIAVLPGATLDIQFSTITKLCESNWSAIYVEGSDTGGQAPGKVTMNFSFIEHANWGIRSASSTQKLQKMLVEATNSTFTHCAGTGVYFRGKSEVDNPSYFDQCIFDNLNYGIIIEDRNNGIEVRNDSEIRNTVSYGILAIDTWMSVKNTLFQYNEGTALHFGSTAPLRGLFDVEGCHFFNNQDAIICDGAAGPGLMIHGECRLADNQRNIAIHGPAMYEITNNTVLDALNGGLSNVLIDFSDYPNTQRIQCNYIQTSGATHTLMYLGDCRNSEFLANSFSTTNLLDVHFQFGDIKDQMGDAVVGAGNCFSTNLTSNVWGNNATKYYTINEGENPTCLTPIASGMTIEESQTTRGPCDPINGYQGEDRDSLLMLYQQYQGLINAMEQQGSLTPEEEQLLQNYETQQFNLLQQIVAQDLESGLVDSALAVLDMDGSILSLLLSYGIYLNDQNFSQAQNILQNLQTDPEYQTFVDIQTVNLRIESQGDSLLTNSERDVLYPIAEDLGRFHAMARSILIKYDTAYFDRNWNLPSGYQASDYEEREIKEVGVYPVPTMGRLHVQLEKPMDEPGLIHVYDRMGTLLLKERMSAMQSKHVLDLHTLPNGLYHITVQDSKGILLLNEKTIVNR